MLYLILFVGFIAFVIWLMVKVIKAASISAEQDARIERFNKSIPNSDKE